jgi:hypothetical protein
MPPDRHNERKMWDEVQEEVNHIIDDSFEKEYGPEKIRELIDRYINRLMAEEQREIEHLDIEHRFKEKKRKNFFKMQQRIRKEAFKLFDYRWREHKEEKNEKERHLKDISDIIRQEIDYFQELKEALDHDNLLEFQRLLCLQQGIEEDDINKRLRQEKMQQEKKYSQLLSRTRQRRNRINNFFQKGESLGNIRKAIGFSNEKLRRPRKNIIRAHLNSKGYSTEEIEILIEYLD